MPTEKEERDVFLNSFDGMQRHCASIPHVKIVIRIRKQVFKTFHAHYIIAKKVTKQNYF